MLDGRELAVLVRPGGNALVGVRAVPVLLNICARSSAILTGRFTSFAHIAASIVCDHTGPLVPKPPPT